MLVTGPAPVLIKALFVNKTLEFVPLLLTHELRLAKLPKAPRIKLLEISVIVLLTP